VLRRLNLVPFESDPIGCACLSLRGILTQEDISVHRVTIGYGPVGAPSRRDWFRKESRRAALLQCVFDPGVDVDLVSRSGLPRSGN